ncbi:hypothetical protein OAA60_00785 [Porticoccaceae bacterium]|nr:hypothetical protein [Porticoccaceae bacterium]
MAINAKTTYTYHAKCQTCGKEFEDQGNDHIPVYFTKQELVESLEALDWAVSGDLCWCEDHDPRNRGWCAESLTEEQTDE